MNDDIQPKTPLTQIRSKYAAKRDDPADLSPYTSDKYEVEYDEDGNPLSEYDFCQQAFKNKGKWDDYYTLAKQTAINNKRFLYVSNWDDESLSNRRMNNKITMEVNLAAIYQRALIKENRTISPQVQIIPTNLKVPSKTAELKAGLLRYIAEKSNTDVQYMNTFQDLCDCGGSALHIVVVQSNSGKLEEELRVKYEDIMDCSFDPDAKEMFREDGDFASVAYRISEQQFKKMFPGEEIPTSVAVDSDNMSDAQYEGTVTLLKYYKRQYRETKVLILENGAQFTEEEYEELKKQYDKEREEKEKLYEIAANLFKQKLAEKGLPDKNLPSFESTMKPFPAIVKEEKSYFEYICGYILSNQKVLQRREYNTDQMPLLYGVGDQRVVNGQLIVIPYAKYAQNMQRFMNWCLSEMTDDLACRIKPTILGTTQNFATNLQDWTNPNRSRVQVAEPDDTNGHMPTVMQAPAVDQGILALYQQAREDIKILMGAGTEVAKTASDETLMTNDLRDSNDKGVYQDNLNKLIAKTNEGLLKLIPSIYDTERTIITKGEDGKLDYQVINKNTYQLDDDSDDFIIENDMSIGDFSVEVYGGSSFFAQQVLGINFLLKIASMNEEVLMPLVIDEVAKLAPFVFSNKICNRFRMKVTPPDVIAQEEGKPAPPPPPPSPDQQIEQGKLKLQAADLKLKEQEQQLEQHKLKMDAIQMVVNSMLEKKEIEAKNIASAAQITAEQIRADTENKRSVEEGMGKLEEMIEKEHDRQDRMHMESAKISKELDNLMKEDKI
ncbi:portal protein [Nitrospira sp. BLG_2]|uniref:portal protein n=1 Tax=Nitrospira sp. BLG_2 TaxID=3397507 RepID=UPI003B9B615D